MRERQVERVAVPVGLFRLVLHRVLPAGGTFLVIVAGQTRVHREQVLDGDPARPRFGGQLRIIEEGDRCRAQVDLRSVRESGAHQRGAERLRRGAQVVQAVF